MTAIEQLYLKYKRKLMYKGKEEKMTKTRSRLLGMFFIILFIACVFGTLTPIAKAQLPPDTVPIVQQTPVQDQYDTNPQMNPNVDPQYDTQPGMDPNNQYNNQQPGMNPDTQYNNQQPGINQDTGTQYDDDINAEMEPELMTQQEANAQSIVLWVLVALGFVTVAVLITISIMRNRDRSSTR